MTSFPNLPQITQTKLDGNLVTASVSGAPVIIVIGTAAQGNSETLYVVQNPSDAVSAFGKSGTLIRGMYEAFSGGAQNVRLFRVGATAAVLSGIGRFGAEDGLTLITVGKDGSMGTDYEIFWDDSELRLYVYRASDDELVYDNNPSSPADATDLGEVSVSGTAATGAGDIGTSSVPLTLAASDNSHGGGYPAFTAGTDGTGLSRIELYENLYNAYQLLEDQQLDLVIPVNTFLDDLNVMDMNSATASGLFYAVSTYPTPGTSTDALGKVYVQEYEGENAFWWWFPAQPNAADMDTQFTLDGGANIFPSVGSGSATLNADGDTLTGSDFHEVNFAYQLANFCYGMAVNDNEMSGVIGVKGPNSYALKDVANWAGTLPTWETSGSNLVVTTNGTGLMGNKFMAGRIASGGATGTPGFTVDSVAGLAYGGFIATDTGWLDGTHQKDANDSLIDIGKYLDVLSAQIITSNPVRANYITTGAPFYAGFMSTLAPEEAPTNKLLRRVSLPFRLSKARLNALSGLRYVHFNNKQQGTVVTDGPTSARPDSDYRRRSTMTQVKECIDGIRRAAERFIGGSLNGAKQAALDTAIDRVLSQLVKRGVIQRYEHEVTVTPSQRILGQATVTLKVVPAFELRRIGVTIALAAV